MSGKHIFFLSDRIYLTFSFLQESKFDCYSAKVSDKLIALADFKILSYSLILPIVYRRATSIASNLE